MSRTRRSNARGRSRRVGSFGGGSKGVGGMSTRSEAPGMDKKSPLPRPPQTGAITGKIPTRPLGGGSKPMPKPPGHSKPGASKPMTSSLKPPSRPGLGKGPSDGTSKPMPNPLSKPSKKPFDDGGHDEFGPGGPDGYAGQPRRKPGSLPGTTAPVSGPGGQESYKKMPLWGIGDEYDPGDQDNMFSPKGLTPQDRTTEPATSYTQRQTSACLRSKLQSGKSIREAKDSCNE